MNERPKPSWDDLALFLIVARTGSLSQAARQTGQSAATIGRHMRNLERQIGHDLFMRAKDGYTLTPEAAHWLNDLAKIERQIDKSLAPFGDSTRQIVKISAGHWTNFYLMQNIKHFADLFERTRLQFLSDEQNVSLQHREAEIAIRNQPPKERGLAGRKLQNVPFAIYAHPDAPHRFIASLVDTPSARWVKSQTDDPICETGSPRNALDLAMQALGKIVLPCFVGDHISELERQSDSIPELTHESWLVTLDDERHDPAIRQVINRIYDLFS